MKRNFNKKKLMLFGLPILCLVLVSAALLTFYGQSTHQINVESPVEYIGDGIYVVEGDYAGTVLEGNKLMMKNNADFEVLMQISDDSDLPRNNGIETTYKGALELTKKTVDFTSDNWDVLGEKVQIEYTVVGDEFSAEVVEEYEVEGYVLVYYADNDDRFANPGETILVESVIGNLPAVGDFNIVNDYSAEYPSTPFGAKIWYIPLTSVGVVDWNDASNFYFESSLIQYNAEGQIIVYPGETLDFTPEFDVSLLFKGTADITTSVAPVM